MSEAFDIRGDVPHNAPAFNKYNWEDQYLLGVCEGQTAANLAILIMVLRRSMGTTEDFDAHVPLVWRQDKTMTEECGCSSPTFRKYRKALRQGGFLFEIASGKGSRQTIKVLKHPGWSKLEALRSARHALVSYIERTGKEYLSWVLDSVDLAIANEEARATAKMRDGTDLKDVGESDQPQDVSGATERSFGLPPYNIKSPHSISETLSLHETDRGTAPPSTTHHSKTKTRSEETTSHDVVDFDHIRGLKTTWKRLFAEFGRSLDEGVALKLARAYAERVAVPHRLAQGTLDHPSGRAEAVESRLMRLFADGCGVGSAARFLLEDASSWRAPVVPEPVQQDLPDCEDDASPVDQTADEVPPEPTVVDLHVPEAWQAVLDELATMVSSHTFESWFAPGTLRCLSVDEERVVLEVDDEFQQAWLVDTHADQLSLAAERALDREVTLELRARRGLGDESTPAPIVWTDPAEASSV